jgi:hypothetical protein
VPWFHIFIIHTFRYLSLIVAVVVIVKTLQNLGHFIALQINRTTEVIWLYSPAEPIGLSSLLGSLSSETGWKNISVLQFRIVLRMGLKYFKFTHLKKYYRFPNAVTYYFELIVIIKFCGIPKLVFTSLPLKISYPFTISVMVWSMY